MAVGLIAVAGFALVVGTAHADAPGSEAAAVQAERARYAGTWKVVAIESDGNRTLQDGRSIVITNRPDGSWTMAVDGREVSCGMNRMDPLARPPEIDIEVTEGDGKGAKLLGIYELNDTTRRLCFRGERDWRPREFSTAVGSGAVLVEFERQ